MLAIVVVVANKKNDGEKNVAPRQVDNPTYESGSTEATDGFGFGKAAGDNGYLEVRPT